MQCGAKLAAGAACWGTAMRLAAAAGRPAGAGQCGGHHPAAAPRSRLPHARSARTPLAQMVTGFTVMLVLLWLTPVFQNMSANVQARAACSGRRSPCLPRSVGARPPACLPASLLAPACRRPARSPPLPLPAVSAGRHHHLRHPAALRRRRVLLPVEGEPAAGGAARAAARCCPSSALGGRASVRPAGARAGEASGLS